MQEKVDLKVDWATHEAAKYACEKFHYSRTFPVNKTVKIGACEDGKYIGAVIFSCGSAGVGNISKSFGLEKDEVAELARVALKNHKSFVSQIVAMSIHKLKKSQPGLKLLVSYADPEQGHVGSIYQAMNWVYIGRSSKDKAYIDKNGKRWHSRSVSNTGYKIHCGVKTKCPKPQDMAAIDIEPKHKYLMPLDKKMKKQIEPLRKPYPKKQGAIDGGIQE